MTQTGSVLIVGLIPLVGVYTWMQGRSKYNLILSLYRWLAANTNSQGFKAHIQEDCGDLEGVVAYGMHFSSFFPINISWADTAHQVFPSISNLTRNSEKKEVFHIATVHTVNWLSNSYSLWKWLTTATRLWIYVFWGSPISLKKYSHGCHFVFISVLCDLPALEPEPILNKKWGQLCLKLTKL